MSPRKTTATRDINEVLWDAVVAKDVKAAKRALKDGANPNTFRIPMLNRDQPGWRRDHTPLVLFLFMVIYDGQTYDIQTDAHGIQEAVQEFMCERYPCLYASNVCFTDIDDETPLPRRDDGKGAIVTNYDEPWTSVEEWLPLMEADLDQGVRVNDRLVYRLHRGPDVAIANMFSDHVVCTYDVMDEDVDHHYVLASEDELHTHRDYVSVLMVAAQHRHTAMLEALVASGADINLPQPTITYADGYGYGGMTPLCYALHCPLTTKWFVDQGADVNITIVGLPGYEDIPCPGFTPLLLAHDITRNDAVGRILVEAGADVNYAAPRNSGYQGRDTTVICYWRAVVASGDVTWARTLLEEYEAEANWPSDEVIDGADISHEGFRATPLIIAVHNNDLPMAQLLHEHGANPNPEHLNLSKERVDEMLCDIGCEDDDYQIREQTCFAARRATPLSIALGNASVPDTALLLENFHGPTDDDELPCGSTVIADVYEPYRKDPMLTFLLDTWSWELKCPLAAARTLAPTGEIMSIMPTRDEMVDNVAFMSAEMRDTYFRTKSERMAEGATEEDAKKAAMAVVFVDPEYGEDSAYGTDMSVEQDGSDTQDMSSEDSSDDTYEEETYELGADGCVIIMDVSDV